MHRMLFWTIFSRNVKIKRISEFFLHNPYTGLSWRARNKTFATFFCSGILLQSVLSSYKPHFIAMRANKFVQILSNSNHDGVTRGHLFRLLGSSLCKQSPPEDQHLAVLNGAWKAITTLTQASEFIHCIESWAEFVSVNFGVSVKKPSSIN